VRTRDVESTQEHVVSNPPHPILRGHMRFCPVQVWPTPHIAGAAVVLVVTVFPYRDLDSRFVGAQRVNDIRAGICVRVSEPIDTLTLTQECANDFGIANDLRPARDSVRHRLAAGRSGLNLTCQNSPWKEMFEGMAGRLVDLRLPRRLTRCAELSLLMWLR
jgi:hypothetical protein